MEAQTQYREAVETAVATVFQSTSLPEQAIFRKEGEFWTVGYGGKLYRLKDTKGLGYLAHLLRHPAIEFHVLDLSGGIAGEREDKTSQSAHYLPHREEDLEKAGIHIASLGALTPNEFAMLKGQETQPPQEGETSHGLYL
jgi:hypothetical protein